MMVMSVGSDVQAVSLAERFCVHDMLGGAFAADDAIQSVDPGSVAVDHGEVVRNQHDCEFMAAMDLADEFVEILFARGINAGSGFVEQEKVGVVQETESDEDALHLAAREAGHRTIQERFDAHFGKDRLEMRIDPSGGLPEPVAGLFEAEREEFADAEHETAFERNALGNITDTRQGMAELLFTEQANFAAMEGLEAEQAAEKSGFSGTIGTDERHDFAFGHLQIHSTKDRVAAEDDVDIARLDNQLRVWSGVRGVAVFAGMCRLVHLDKTWRRFVRLRRMTFS